LVTNQDAYRRLHTKYISLMEAYAVLQAENEFLREQAEGTDWLLEQYQKLSRLRSSTTTLPN